LSRRQPGRAEEPPRDAFAAACRYLTARERCAAEVRSYLRRVGFESADIDPAIDRLLAERLVDDMRYSRLYVESRCRRAPRAGALLTRELTMRGVSPETARRAVDEFLAEVPEEELARRVLEKLPGSGEQWKRRAARRLASRGFRPSLVLRGTGGSGIGGGADRTDGADGTPDDWNDDFEPEED
jgi:regulatory protein